MSGLVMARRRVLAGALAAPLVARLGVLMPVRPVLVHEWCWRIVPLTWKIVGPVDGEFVTIACRGGWEEGRDAGLDVQALAV